MTAIADELGLVASICMDDFTEFVKEFWECIPGTGQTGLVWNWHMDFLCKELQSLAEDVFEGRPRKHDEIVNISPGTSKSSICSVLFPAWVWTRMPEARFICASHTAELVTDLGNKSREVVRSDKYQACFPHVQASPTQDAKGYYGNSGGGSRLACTVGGKTPTGFHAHFIIVDDPIDPQGAMSELELKAASHFMTNVIPTRKVDKLVSVTILIMQRLHRQDPTAVMLDLASKEGATPVRHVCLPGEIKDNWDVQPPELRSLYTADGLMDKNRLSWPVLRDLMIRLGPYGYSGQIGQSPTPAGGGMFKETYFNQRCKSAPYHARRIRYWDRAATQDGGCYTAGVLMSKDANGDIYVEDVVHGQWEPTDRNRIMRATAMRDRGRYGPKNEPDIWVEAEGGSSGKDAWKGVVKALEGFRVQEDRVTGDKDRRAEPWSSQCAALNVYLVDNGESQGVGKAGWDINRYVQEHVMFKPESGKRGRYKDQVDASSGAYNLLIGRAQPKGQFRILPVGKKKPKGFRIFVLAEDQLGAHVDHEEALLVYFRDLREEVMPDDPGNGAVYVNEAVGLPAHGLVNLLGSLVLDFNDLAPAEHQQEWLDQPGLEDKVMKPADGKKLWAFLLKKRSSQPRSYVFVDAGGEDRRALSCAAGVSDCLHLKREETVFGLSEVDYIAGDFTRLNQHCYDVVKASRHLVVG